MQGNTSINREGRQYEVDAGKVTTEKEAHIYPDGHARTVEPLAHMTDEDTSTNLSFDVAGIGGYDCYVVEMPLGGYGSGIGQYVKLRVNNLHDAGYKSIMVGGTTIAGDPPAAWVEEVLNSARAYLKWVVYDPVTVEATNNRGASVRSLTSGHPSFDTMVYGYLNGSERNISELNISTDFNAIANITVTGVQL